MYHLRISPAGRHVNWARDSIISPPLSIHAIFYASSVLLVVGGEKQCRTGKINNVFYLFEVFESDENYCTRINVSASSFVNKDNWHEGKYLGTCIRYTYIFEKVILLQKCVRSVLTSISAIYLYFYFIAYLYYLVGDDGVCSKKVSCFMLSFSQGSKRSEKELLNTWAIRQHL